MCRARGITLNSTRLPRYRPRSWSFIAGSSFSRFEGPRRPARNYSPCFLSLLFPAVSYERHVCLYLDMSKGRRHECSRKHLSLPLFSILEDDALVILFKLNQQAFPVLAINIIYIIHLYLTEINMPLYIALLYVYIYSFVDDYY